MKQDDFNFICSTCQEPLDYDPGDYPCEKCEWWLEEERKEQEKYERMMWERQQYGREQEEYERYKSEG